MHCREATQGCQSWCESPKFVRPFCFQTGYFTDSQPVTSRSEFSVPRSGIVYHLQVGMWSIDVVVEPPANQDVHSLRYDFGTINAVRVIEIQCIDCQYICYWISVLLYLGLNSRKTSCCAFSSRKGANFTSRGVRGVVGSEDCCLLQQVNHGQKEMRWICTS